MINVVIDISHYQSAVDFVKLKASNVLGVIHKASQGSDHKDSLYNEHRVKAVAAGLLWGAYHMVDTSDVGEQVKNFLAAAKPDKDTLLAVQWMDLGGSSGSSGGGNSSSGGELEEGPQEPVAAQTSSEGELEEGKQEPIDSSSSSGSPGSHMSVADLRKFVTLVSEQQNGKFPVLCSGSVAKQELGDSLDPVLKNCPFWIVQYADHPSDIPLTFGKTFSLWQYTDGSSGPEPHEAPGVGPCFRDRFNGEKSGLLELWGQGSAAVPDKVPDKPSSGRGSEPSRGESGTEKEKEPPRGSDPRSRRF
jgi:lysozyme